MNPKTVWAFDVTGNGTDTLELAIYDVVSGSGWGGGVSAKDVLSVLKMNPTAKDIRVRINSQGGEVSDGLAIYNLLHQHSAKVTVDIDGMAASIASVIAMAGNERRISAVGTLMIHNPWSMAAGDGDAMRKQADVLDLRRDQLAQVYSVRTGQPVKSVLKAMADETYMNAESAKELGYVDTVVPLLGPTPEETAALGTAQVFALGAHNVEGFVQPNGRIAYGKVVSAGGNPQHSADSVPVLRADVEKLKEEIGSFRRALESRTALTAVLETTSGDVAPANQETNPPPGRQSPDGEGATIMSLKKADKTLAKFAAKACRAAHEKGEHKEMVSACKGCADSLDDLLKTAGGDDGDEKDLDVVQVLARADLFAAVEKATGKTGAEAIGAVDGWKESAAEFNKLSAEKAALEKAATAKSVDDAIAAAQRPDANGRVKIVPAEVDSLKAQGLKDPEWLKGYLAAKPAAITLGDNGVSQPGAAAAHDSTDVAAHVDPAAGAAGGTVEALTFNGKTYAQLSLQERSDMRAAGHEELYQKMRKEHYGDNMPKIPVDSKHPAAFSIAAKTGAQRV